MTRDRVRAAFDDPVNPQTDLNTLIDQIFEIKTLDGHHTRQLKILIILALIGKPKAITDFIIEGIHDVHLPLERKQTQSGSHRLYRKHRVEDRDYDILVTCTDSWEQRDIQMFDDRQYEVCVPIFDLPTDESISKVSHYNLHRRAVLPFIEDDAGKNVMSGGFGEVWRVRLHPAHHNLGQDSVSVSTCRRCLLVMPA